MNRLAAGAALAAALAYPLLAHGAAAAGSDTLALLALLLLLLLALAPALRRASVLAWAALAGGAAALAWLFSSGQAFVPMYLVPVAINLLVAWLFGRSLRAGATPLVEGIATRMHGAPLGPELTAYTRAVTLGWTLLLVALALVNAALAALAVPDGLLVGAGIATPLQVPRSLWSLFANLLNYAILGLAFLAEFLWRRHRFPAHAQGGLRAFVAGLLRLGPGMLRADPVHPARPAHPADCDAASTGAATNPGHPWRVPASHPALAGHFPGRPVVPGVLLLEAVLGAAEAAEGAPLALAAVPSAKFLQPLLPDQEARIHLQREGTRLRFRVLRDDDLLAQGTLELAA